MTKEDRIALLATKIADFKADLITSLELPTAANPGTPPDLKGIQASHNAEIDLTRVEIRLHTYFELLPA